MLYHITKPVIMNITSGMVYNFDIGNYTYIENDAFVKDLAELERYCPTMKESEQMLAQYKSWCDTFHQAQNQDLIAHLTDMETHRQELMLDLNNQAARFEDNLNKDMYFTSQLGFKCNGDRRTKSNLQDLVTFFDYQANSNGTISYRDYDNIERTLSKEQLTLLLQEHVMNGQHLYNQKWEYEKAITEAADFDDLNAINISFSMADYSGLAG